MGDAWINANLARGHQHMTAKQYAQALTDYQAALQIPASLQEAAGNVASRKAEISYFIGNAYQALGDSANARRFWANRIQRYCGRPLEASGPGAATQFRRRGNIGGLAAGVRVEQDTLYYQALALQKLGQPDRAAAIYTGLSILAQRCSRPRHRRRSSPEQPQPSEHILGRSLPCRPRPARAESPGPGAAGVRARTKSSPDHYSASRALRDMAP